MSKMGPKLKNLAAAEGRALKAYCAKNGGQEVVAVGWGISSSRITRAINRKSAPQKKFRNILIAAKIVKA